MTGGYGRINNAEKILYYKSVKSLSCYGTNGSHAGYP